MIQGKGCEKRRGGSSMCPKGEVKALEGKSDVLVGPRGAWGRIVFRKGDGDVQGKGRWET